VSCSPGSTEDLSAGTDAPDSSRPDAAPTVPAPRTAAPETQRPVDDLLPAERQLLDHAAAGEWLSFPCEENVSLDDMREWGDERTIRAAALRQLLVEDRWPVHAKGVMLRGARIVGSLDLEHARLRCPLRLDKCYLDSDEPPNFTAAEASALSFTHCQKPAGLIADQMLAEHGLRLIHSVLAGPCRLRGARITGTLSLSSTELAGTDPDKYSLIADRATIDGGVFLTEGFTAKGAIRLPGANITGQLVCDSAQLHGTDKDGDALNANKSLIRGGAFLTGTFVTNGTVRLRGAPIRGPLDLEGAQLHGTDEDGKSLDAAGLHVVGDVFLNGGFIADGAIVLREAQIEGSLDLTKSQLLGEPVTLDAEGLRVGHNFVWAPTKSTPGDVILERATVHRLDDEWGPERPEGHWPADGRLKLDGLTYGGFGGEKRASLQQRLAWIRKGHATTKNDVHAYRAQPYQQLAHVYRQNGQDAEAREVAIAQRADLRQYGHLTPGRKIADWLLDVTIRYGYRPGRAVWVLLVLYLAAFCLLWHGQHQEGLIVPTRAVSELSSVPTAEVCSPDYPCYYPLGHAFDTVVPIIKTGQSDHWRINAQAPGGAFYTAATWALTILGWAFSTLAVVGFTGIVRKE